MKFKAGDEVFIKAKIKDMSYVDMMYVCELVTNPDVCIRFKSPTECIVPDKTYSQGLADAWELARKIVMGATEGGFESRKVIDIFGKTAYYTLKELTYEEALAKIEAYEKEKEIKVGDEVECIGVDGIVTKINSETAYVIWKDGSFGNRKIDDLRKTGKHIDIESLLRQIGE